MNEVHASRCSSSVAEKISLGGGAPRRRTCVCMRKISGRFIPHFCVLVLVWLLILIASVGSEPAPISTVAPISVRVPHSTPPTLLQREASQQQQVNPQTGHASPSWESKRSQIFAKDLSRRTVLSSQRKKNRHRVSMLDDEFETGDEPDRGTAHNARAWHPAEPLSKLRQGGSTSGSIFEVDITGAPSQSHIEAIRYCMDLASKSWTSTETVRVRVQFANLGSSLTLGTGQPSRNWLLDGVQMPMALAKAVEQEDLNAALSGSNNYDVLIDLNSKAPWYTKTDAKTADFTFDLVTVCLHEAYHGLLLSGNNINVGFSETYQTFAARHINPDKIGRFDQFMANHENCNIVGYKFNRTLLGAVLTSNNLFFADSSGRRVAELFAPRPNINGSSLYHLSESAYSGARSDDLMTPIINMAYAQHNIGPTVLDMQALMLNFDNEPGARVCEAIGAPIITSNPVTQSNGADGDSSRQNSNIPSFSVTLFGKTMSGWILVGVGIGLLVGVLLVLVLCFRCSQRRNPRRPTRTVKREEAVAKREGGNEGELV